MQPFKKSRMCVYIYLCVCTDTLRVYTYVRKMLYIHKGKKTTCMTIWVCVYTDIV